MQTVFDSHVDPALIEQSLAASSFDSMWLDIPRTSYDALSGSVTADLLVVGGGNSAVESAVALADSGSCASVAISYRRAEFARCRAQNRERIAAAIARGAVQALMSTEVQQIAERALLLRDAQGQLRQVTNDAVLVQIGGMPPARLLGSLGITLVTKYGER